MPNWADPLASVTIGQRARPNSPPTYALRMPPAYRSFIRNFFITPSAASIVRMYCVFLGKQFPQMFRSGEVKSTLKNRPEGVRVRHSVKGNSLKLYDKEGSI